MEMEGNEAGSARGCGGGAGQAGAQELPDGNTSIEKVCELLRLLGEQHAVSVWCFLHGLRPCDSCECVHVLHVRNVQAEIAALRQELAQEQQRSQQALAQEQQRSQQALAQEQQRSLQVARKEVCGVCRLFITCAAAGLSPASIRAAQKLASLSLHTSALEECARQE